MDKDVLLSQQESIVPSQVGRFITAERRRAMAEERARILGRQGTLPSALEVAAAQWEREQEARKRAEQERLIVARQAEMSAFSLQRVALRAEDLPEQASAYPAGVTPPGDGEVDWVCFGWEPQGNSGPRPPRVRGVATFARRLMAVERARTRRQGPPNLIAPARRRRLIQDGR